MYTCVHMNMCACFCFCLCAYVFLFIYVCACVCACVYVRVNARTCVPVCFYLCMCVRGDEGQRLMLKTILLLSILFIEAGSHNQTQSSSIGQSTNPSSVGGPQALPSEADYKWLPLPPGTYFLWSWGSELGSSGLGSKCFNC